MIWGLRGLEARQRSDQMIQTFAVHLDRDLYSFITHSQAHPVPFDFMA